MSKVLSLCLAGILFFTVAPAQAATPAVDDKGFTDCYMDTWLSGQRQFEGTFRGRLAWVGLVAAGGAFTSVVVAGTCALNGGRQ
jgi:hypothetical protein